MSLYFILKIEGIHILLSAVLLLCGVGIIIYSILGANRSSLNVYLFFTGILIISSTVFSDLLLLAANVLQLQDKSAPRITVALSVATILFLILLAQVFYYLAEMGHAIFENTLQLEASNALRIVDMTTAEYAIIIPAYNEYDNLQRLIPDLLDKIDIGRVQIIIVDDGSTDLTSSLEFASAVKIVPLIQNRGGGTALQVGFRLAKLLGVTKVITMDGDCQHRPEDVQKLMDKLDEGVDLVIGSRMLGQPDMTSRIRTIGIKVFAIVISILTGQKLTDTSSGFRAINMKALSRVNLNQHQYHTSELIIRFAKANNSIEEIPIKMEKRAFGETKKGHSLFYAFNYLRVIVSSALFYK